MTCKIEEIKIGDTISFKYKGGRKVKLKVTDIEEKYIVGEMLTDYIGKNETWEIGERKAFYKKEMR